MDYSRQIQALRDKLKDKYQAEMKKADKVTLLQRCAGGAVTAAGLAGMIFSMVHADGGAIKNWAFQDQSVYFGSIGLIAMGLTNALDPSYKRWLKAYDNLNQLERHVFVK